MMTGIFSLFYLRVLYISYLEVFDFEMFSELDIVDWFLTWPIKNARTPMNTQFKNNIYHIYQCLQVIYLYFGKYLAVIKYYII